MPPDQPPMFFTSGEMDCNEHYSACLMSMTPITSSDEYAGVPTYDNSNNNNNSYPPWMNTGCDYSLDLPAESLYNTTYDSYALPLVDAPTTYLTPETLDAGLGSRNGSVSTINTSTTDSSVTEYGYLGADTDANRVPDLVPSSDSQKRGSDSSERPPKRNCSQTVASNGTPTTAARPATRSKENRPPVAASTSRTSKPKAGDRSETGKKFSDKARASSSNSTAATVTTTIHKAPQLRTASRRPKVANVKGSGSSPTVAAAAGDHRDKDADDVDLLTPDERRARHSHNLVEKQYRNRLNQQFESLLAVLPPADGVNRVFSAAASNRSSRQRDRARGSVAGLEGGGGGGGGAGDDRRLSKAEVLDMARQRIVTLEGECDRLRSQNLDFAANVGAVRNAVARGGIAGAAAAA